MGNVFAKFEKTGKKRKHKIDKDKRKGTGVIENNKKYKEP